MSAVHGVRMATVAKAAGIPASFGASPFALARGQQFEANLLEKGGHRLLPELERHGLLAGTSGELIDLRIRANGGSDPSLTDLDDAIARTEDVLAGIGAMRGASVADSPSVIAGATLRIPRGVMLPEALLIVDLLAIRSTDDSHLEAKRRAIVSVGEVKTYPDRGGETSRADLATARAQLGLYLHALEVVLEGMKPNERPLLDDEGFLVLSRPGSNFPRVRAGEQLRYQAERARRGFDLLEAAALALPRGVAADEDQVADLILHADKNYSEACLQFCDLADHCHDLMVAEDDPRVLGDAMAMFLTGVKLSRAAELLGGAPPLDDREAELVQIMRSAEEPGWE